MYSAESSPGLVGGVDYYADVSSDEGEYTV